MALLYVQEILKLCLDHLDEGVTLFTVSVSGICSLSLFLIWNPQRFVTLRYVGRWRSHEEVHSALHRPLDILLYNFTSSFDGLNWTLYTEYITVSEIIVIC